MKAETIAIVKVIKLVILTLIVTLLIITIYPRS